MVQMVRSHQSLRHGGGSGGKGGKGDRRSFIAGGSVKELSLETGQGQLRLRSVSDTR